MLGLLIALGKKGIVSVYRAESERTHDGVKNIRFEACGNVCRVLGIAVGLSLRATFKVVELLLSLSLGFAGSVGVVDRTEQRCHVSTYVPDAIEYAKHTP